MSVVDACACSGNQGASTPGVAFGIFAVEGAHLLHQLGLALDTLDCGDECLRDGASKLGLATCLWEAAKTSQYGDLELTREVIGLVAGGEDCRQRGARLAHTLTEVAGGSKAVRPVRYCHKLSVDET
jgi:hypothetical protein